MLTKIQRMSKKVRSQRGQVLMIGVIIMLILLVMIFFLFDLQNLVRQRIKTQSGVDAAALTGAAWQGRALNMEGELNLLLAATALLTEIPPVSTDEPTIEEVIASSRRINDLQTRLTYVGPLLGLASAQQSAKHNGLRVNGGYSALVSAHVNEWLTAETGDLYREMYGDDPDDLGYYWVRPYASMLNGIASRGVAARPTNSRYLFGTPSLTGNGNNLLIDPEFYEAIILGDYCWFSMNGLTPDHGPIDIGGIGFSANPSAWFPGSEIMNLNVTFSSAGVDDEWIQPYLDDRNMLMNPELALPPGSDRNLDSIRWCTYDSRWDDTSTMSALEPYLRSDFRSEFRYGGCGARFVGATHPPVISGKWNWQYGENQNGRSGSLGKEFAWSDRALNENGDSFADYAERIQANESRLRSLSDRQSVRSVSSAKPFGRIDDDSPNSVPLVLPVFTMVRLVPVVLVEDSFYDRDPMFYRFIVDYFGNESFPNVPEDILNQYSYYLRAIDLWNDMDSNFRNAWRDFEEWRIDYIDGDDDELNTDDDQRDPCDPPPPGGPGRGSRGGPGIIH